MDGLNNNTINSFDLNYGNTVIFGDDLRNHNESRTTARITPLTSPPYSSQDGRRMSIDRMKDRQIAILVQKNKQLQMDVLAMQHRASNHLPMMHEYGMLEQYGMSSKHLQLKLLTTALDEKTEELKQAREEHDLIMEERAAVHKELREQTAEIERLTRQNYYFKEQLCGSNQSDHFKVATNINEELTNKYRDIAQDNDDLKYELSHQQRIIQDLTVEKERTCKQLDQVVNHYHNLKKSFKQRRSMTEPKFQQFTDEKYEMLTDTIRVTDLKMALLNLVIDNSGDSDSDSIRQLESGNKSLDRRHHYLDQGGSCQLRCDDRLVDIEGVDVAELSDDQILDHLSRYGPGKYIRVIISRPCGRSGTFHSWKTGMNISAVESFGLSPLWLVTKVDLSRSHDLINAGDILQVCETTNGTNSVSVVRLTMSPFIIPDENIENSTRHNSIDCGADSNSVTNVKPSIFFPPVLPMKKTQSTTDHDVHPKSLDRLISVKSSRIKSNKSNASIVSAPPIPPRSSTSLQCSFTDNTEMHNQDYTELTFNEDSVSEKLKMSVHSAFTGTGDPDGSVLSSEIMSASFSGSGDFVSTKMPKLGKCRNLILGIPSQIFNLKQLGLHLLHSKNDQCPSSKSDVDLSVINQIFIRFIEPNSSARQAGLFEGDEIISINNQPVSRMTAEEAEHILLTNPLKQHNLHKEHKKLSLRIKVQFNPLKMYELAKDLHGSTLESNVRFTRFTRSMYDDSRSNSFVQDKWNSHRLHVIRSSSNLNICESPDKSLDIVEHLSTKTRIVRINMCTVLSQIKIMGGSAMGIFISNIVYRDKESETMAKESIGNRLALGDKIIDINGESYLRAIGEDAITSLNTFGHHVTLTVLYEPAGLLAINSDPFCQEHFYMEAMFSFSEIDSKLPTMSNKVEKSTSLSTRLDTFGLGVYFIKNYHLHFDKGDLLLVEATILPSSLIRRQQETYRGSDWHAWVVDRTNNKIRSGMIPSALWIQKMMTTAHKSTFHRSPLSDKTSRFSMRSTPSSPKSDINTFLSSNSTHIVSQPCSKHNRQSSLSQKLFRRFSFRNSFHSTTTTTTASVDDTYRKISFSKDVAFRPMKRIASNCEMKRPIIVLGAHAETISMILASKWSPQFRLSTIKATLESKNDGMDRAHIIISPVTIKAVSDLHQHLIYPIVLLLKYKSAKEIRQLKIGKSTQITVNKSDSFKLLSHIKELENHWSHLINGSVTPSTVTESCQEIRDMIDKIQMEDIWLRVEKFQYSS